MLCLWRLTYNQERRSLDGFTSTKAPIHAVVRAPFRVSDAVRRRKVFDARTAGVIG
jgi:hypothetical protein